MATLTPVDKPLSVSVLVSVSVMVSPVPEDSIVDMPVGSESSVVKGEFCVSDALVLGFAVHADSFRVDVGVSSVSAEL